MTSTAQDPPPTSASHREFQRPPMLDADGARARHRDHRRDARAPARSRSRAHRRADRHAVPPGRLDRSAGRAPRARQPPERVRAASSSRSPRTSRPSSRMMRRCGLSSPDVEDRADRDVADAARRRARALGRDSRGDDARQTSSECSSTRRRGRQRLDQVLALYAWHGPHHIAHVTSLRERMGW